MCTYVARKKKPVDREAQCTIMCARPEKAYVFQNGIQIHIIIIFIISSGYKGYADYDSADEDAGNSMPVLTRR